jgi:hypothetical protein
MLIRVIENAGSIPEPDSEGEELWSASYGDPTTEDEDGLSASVLASMLPEFQIGTWYELQSLRQKLDAANIEEAQSWTILDAFSKDISGVTSFEVQVQTSRAALAMCRAVVDHVCRLGKGPGVWLRVE